MTPINLLYQIIPYREIGAEGRTGVERIEGVRKEEVGLQRVREQHRGQEKECHKKT